MCRFYRKAVKATAVLYVYVSLLQEGRQDDDSSISLCVVVTGRPSRRRQFYKSMCRCYRKAVMATTVLYVYVSLLQEGRQGDDSSISLCVVVTGRPSRRRQFYMSMCRCYRKAVKATTVLYVYVSLLQEGRQGDDSSISICVVVTGRASRRPQFYMTMCRC